MDDMAVHHDLDALSKEEAEKYFEDMSEQEEMEYFMREEAERDERERMWADEAHRAMFRDRDARIDGGLEVTE